MFAAVNITHSPWTTLPNGRKAGHRRLRILDELLRGERLSQRDLARRLNISAAFLNRCLHEMEQAGFIEVVDRGVRPFLYRVTAEGKHFRRHQVYRRYHSIAVRFANLERRICTRLIKLKENGVRRIVCYGTGDVMEIAQRCAASVGLQVIGAVDEDREKQVSLPNGLLVHAPSAIEWLKPDAVVLTGYTSSEAPDGSSAPSGTLIVHL